MADRTRISELISFISDKNQFQAKALEGLEEKLTPDETAGLDALLAYYMKQGNTIEQLAGCYLEHVQDFMEEEYYFIKNGHYRYSNSEEVNAFFYQNPEYMEYYMKGLAISAYLLDYHRQCRAWFCEKISAKVYGGVYLDAGVGHGEYFVLAINHTNYKQYLGVDISPTSVQMCREMVKARVSDKTKNIEVREQDFFAYDGPVCDAVILGEILEHVERPQLFLEKIHRITHEDSFIYVTTVVNGPAKDHIYLFRTVEEVEELYRSAGFDIADRLICPSNGYTLEKAVKRRASIITAHILKKTGLRHV